MRKDIINTLIVLAIVGVIALVVSLFIPVVEAFRFTYGAFYILFVPGFVFSFIFFGRKAVPPDYRIIVSVALSIGIVPISIFLLNKIGIGVDLLNSLIITTIAILVGFMLLYIQHWIGKRKKAKAEEDVE